MHCYCIFLNLQFTRLERLWTVHVNRRENNSEIGCSLIVQSLLDQFFFRFPSRRLIPVSSLGNILYFL